MKIIFNIASASGAWLKWAGFALFGLLLCLILLIAGFLFVLDESGHQRVLAWSADYFLDSELEITGPLSIGYSEGILFSAQGVRLQAHDGSFSLEADSFSTNFYLVSVFSGALWIHDLTLDGFRLKINEAEETVEPSVFSMPPIVIAHGKISNLAVEYQEAAPGTLHSFSLDELLIDDVNDAGPVTIQASGRFKGHEFRLDGSLPPLESIHDDGAKPVALGFTSEKITASLNGNITDLVNGRGMELELKASAREMHEYIEIFADGIPALGKLDVAARIRGDYHAPRLEDIDLRMQRGERVGLEVTGEVADATTGEGAKLQIAGESDHPAVLSWLLFKEQDRLKSVSLKAALEISDGRYLVSGLDVKAVTPEGLSLSLAGAGEIFGAGHEFSKGDAGFTINIKAPKTSIFKLLDRRDVPDLGPVSGVAALAIGLDAVGLYDANISIGRSQGTHVSLQGDMGYIPLNHDAEIRETGLQLTTSTVDLAKLGAQLGYEWPDLGHAELSGELDIKNNELRLEHARLNLGDPAQPTIKTNGSLKTELNKGSTVELEFDVAVTDLVAAVSDKKPGYLGRLQGDVNFSDMDGSWGIEKINLASSQTSLYQANISGSYDDLVNFDEGSIKITIAINDMVALGAALEIDLPDYGAYRADGMLTGAMGKLSYRGSASLGASTSKTELDGYLKDGKPHFTGKFVLPVLHLADIGLAAVEAEPSDELIEVQTGSGYVFSRQPLDTGFLNDFNLEFDFAIDEVRGEALAIDSLNAHVSVQDGHLIVSPFLMVFEGGNSEIYLDVKDGEVPAYQFRITADDLQIGTLLAQMQNEVPLHGYTNLHLDLTATGRSPHELASSLNGTASLGLENARIPKKYVDLLSVDVLGWVASKSVARETYINLNCVVISFESKDGMVTSHTIVADGPRLSLGGRIDMNLGEETLDIILMPKEKKKIFSSISPVKVKGPMNNPVVEAIPAKAAIKEIGTLALLPGVFIPVKAVEKLWGMLDDGDKVGEGCAGLDAVGEAAMKKLQKEAK